MFYLIPIIVVGFLFLLMMKSGRSSSEPITPSSRPSDGETKKQRMTDRRRLREILDSNDYDTLTEWEKTFCEDVSKQTSRLTYAQSDKICEIYYSLYESEESRNLRKRHLRDCEEAFGLLKEIIASPAFGALPPKEQKYMKRIYDEGGVSGSYRLRRVREVHDKIAKP